jgi:hypothetical protein
MVMVLRLLLISCASFVAPSYQTAMVGMVWGGSSRRTVVTRNQLGLEVTAGLSGGGGSAGVAERASGGDRIVVLMWGFRRRHRRGLVGRTVAGATARGHGLPVGPEWPTAPSVGVTLSEGRRAF